MAAHPQAGSDLAQTLDGVLGFEYLDVGEEEATARFTVEDRVRQPMGIVHGGAYAALAESLCSYATHLAVKPQAAAMGLANQTNFLRPVAQGTITAFARRRHRGKTTWVWEVEFSDDRGRLCALTRMTMAVRPA